jgi:hypothetical protein
MITHACINIRACYVAHAYVHVAAIAKLSNTYARTCTCICAVVIQSISESGMSSRQILQTNSSGGKEFNAAASGRPRNPCARRVRRAANDPGLRRSVLGDPCEVIHSLSTNTDGVVPRPASGVLARCNGTRTFDIGPRSNTHRMRQRVIVRRIPGRRIPDNSAFVHTPPGPHSAV